MCAVAACSAITVKPTAITLPPPTTRRAKINLSAILRPSYRLLVPTCSQLAEVFTSTTKPLLAGLMPRLNNYLSKSAYRPAAENVELDELYTIVTKKRAYVVLSVVRDTRLLVIVP